jgi:hypothetical protein
MKSTGLPDAREHRGLSAGDTVRHKDGRAGKVVADNPDPLRSPTAVRFQNGMELCDCTKLDLT